MLAAIGDVALVAADLHLLAFAFHPAIGLDAHHHGGFAAARANGFDFGEGIGPGEKGRAAGNSSPRKSVRRP